LSKKGQLFSLDMILSIAIFSFILIAAISSWGTYVERSAYYSERADMQVKAEVAMHSLVLTSGPEVIWYRVKNFSSIGITSAGDYVLDPVRLQGLVDRNDSYSNVTTALGVVGYELNIRVVNDSGTVYSFGILPAGKAQEVVHIERLGYLDKRPATIVVEVWKDE
jgi:hypothetical protein